MTEQQRETRYAMAEAHRRAWGVDPPPNGPVTRAQLPPEHRNAGALPDLRVDHHDSCVGPRPETTVWCRPGTREPLLVVTRCLDCAAETRQRAAP